jgi:membrane protease YdiL (CAAX protease family)
MGPVSVDPDPARTDEQPLDVAVGRTRDVAAPWGRTALAVVLAVVLVSAVVPVVVYLADLPTGDDAVAGYTLLGEVLLGLAVVFAARPLARRAGGWQAAFGMTPPASGEGGRILRWTGLQVLARIGIGIVLLAAIPALRDDSGNLGSYEDVGTAGATMLLLAGVAVAPVVEELAFRGVLLRALMRRVPFTWAAVLSSIVFGLLHAPGGSSWAAAAGLVVMITAFGFLQCLLVRRTGILGPAIGVHATLNLLVIGLTLLGEQSS